MIRFNPNIQLKTTDDGVYYLHDYIPVKAFRYHSDDEVAMSKKIWTYKDGEANAMSYFTNEMMYAIAALGNGIRTDKIGLIAVPPSKVNKRSSVAESIAQMTTWYNQGLTKTIFGTQKAIYDYSHLLTRISDISTAHEGIRATYEQQKDSIYCNRDRLSKYWTAFFILDDVTTRGTSMEVCKDILLEHGANEKYIYQLAIARTV